MILPDYLDSRINLSPTTSHRSPSSITERIAFTFSHNRSSIDTVIMSDTNGNGSKIDTDQTNESKANEDSMPDPYLVERSPVVREGDFVVLAFGDGRQIFAQCVKSWKGKTPPVKVNKRSYTTANLVGLPYGTVLELGPTGLIPLPEGEGLFPNFPGIDNKNGGGDLEDKESTADDNTFPSIEQTTDNRNLVDNNTSQTMDQDKLKVLKDAGVEGSEIVKTIVENSATFEGKTEFSKAKYIARKQMKYQPRCRMVRCTPYSVCETMFLKDPKRIMNMREDTLGQILSYSNISAGAQCLVMETCMGVVTGAVASRMGGYGRIFSVYSGQQPTFLDFIPKYNLSFVELNSIKWVHSGDIFNEEAGSSNDAAAKDVEKAERDALEWPCPLQPHTKEYVGNMGTEKERKEFLAKRAARFARKMTRDTPTETITWLKERPCDSIILACRYDPTATLLELLPYLANSCPFVVYCEYIEPLSECFRELQRQKLAKNIRLSDTWMREYQVLPGRTHPAMNMYQSGGFILTGIKLCPVSGHNELDEDLAQELRAIVGGRRGKKKKKKDSDESSSAQRETKRART